MTTDKSKKIKWYCSLCERSYWFNNWGSVAKHWAEFHYGGKDKLRK